jgi:glycosyltransferase involved in cell wall biosynthesis
MRPVVMLVPGDLDTSADGYEYSRRLASGLRERGWAVDVRVPAAGLLPALPDGAAVIVDALALGALASEAAHHASRLRLIALVHEPACEHTDLDTAARTANRAEPRALQAACHVVVTSGATAALLETCGVPRQRITSITPGTDPAPLARGSGSRNVHLLCVAALTPRNGHDILFRALAASHHHGWRLTCVGSLHRDVATASRLRALLAELAISERVTFAGEQDPGALADSYDTADVFVLPKLLEGYGMAVAGAVARGLPVIATRTGGIPDIVRRDAGVVVKPGDVVALSHALTAVMANVHLRARLSYGAQRARVLLPTWEQACARMADVLERVIST